MDKILFFGYGGNRSRSKIKEAIGRDPGAGIGAILKDFTLNVQILTQLPKVAQDFLQKIYGNDFKAYTIKKGEGIVSGVIYEFSNLELERMKEWEFVGIWREIIKMEVTTSSNETVKVYTEKSNDSFPTTFVVDGLIYDVFAFTRKGAKGIDSQEYYTQKQLEKIRKWFAEKYPKK